MKTRHRNHYQNSSKRTPLVFASLGLVIVVVAVAAILYSVVAPKTHAAKDTENTTTKETSSPFSYKSVGTWGHPIKNGQSLALFGKRDKQAMSPCFVSVNYEPGKIDIAKKLKTTESLATSGASHVTKLATKPMTMTTDTGVKHYMLDQFDVTTPSGQDPLMGGMEYGYVATKDGSIKITGNCEQSNLLPTTIDALAGISFDSTKVVLTSTGK